MPISSIRQFCQDLTRRPDWYLWDLHADEAIFVNMDAESYRESIFTDSRIICCTPQRITLKEFQLYQEMPMDRSSFRKVGYIFHMAHCGSTLLARSFDFLGTTLVYREPRVLRKLGCARFTNIESSIFQSRLDCIVLLLTRTFNSEQIPIVKANVPVNFILPELISTPVHDLTGVLLYQDLDIYLLNLYKNAQQRHQWIEGTVRELAFPISQLMEMRVAKVLSLPVDKKLVLLWFAQMRCYQSALSISSNMLPVNTEDYFADPKSTLIRVAVHFGVTLDKEKVSEIVNSRLYETYSKSDGYFPYNNALRVKVQLKQQEKYHKDIACLMAWARKIFGELPVLL